MSDLSHLAPAAADMLQAPNDQRIRAILGERWVQHARAGQLLRILDLLLEHPRTTRMPSIAVYGDSGMGKTMMMQRFRDQHPPRFAHQAVSSARVSSPCNSRASRASGACTPKSCRRWGCRRTRVRRWLNLNRPPFA